MDLLDDLVILGVIIATNHPSAIGDDLLLNFTHRVENHPDPTLRNKAKVKLAELSSLYKEDKAVVL